MTQGKLRKVGMIVARWLPVPLLVFAFGAQGLAKFSETSGWTVAFRHWGYPDWFRMLIGALEILAAACLLWGRTAIFGAFIIVCVMTGAMTTHIVQDGGRHITSEVVPMTLSLLILVLRRDQVAALLKRQIR